MGMTQNPAEVVDMKTLDKVLLYDEEGEVYRTGLFWEKRPAILIFLRHFGCIACRAHAKDVWRNKDKYEAKGAQLFFIGNGKPQMIKAFKEELKIKGAPIYTDPTLMAFKAAGLKRGLLSAFGPSSVVDVARLMMAGERSAPSQEGQGDTLQLGGVLAIKPGPAITYHYVSESIGDVEENEAGHASS